MNLMQRVRGPAGLQLVLALGLAACALGLLLAVWLEDPSFGQRGGAVAVALTFLMLFLGRDTAAWALAARIGNGLSSASGSSNPVAGGVLSEGAGHGDGPEAATIARLAARIDQIEDELPATRNAVAAQIDWQGREKVPLAILSVVGTLMAGFGDLVASALGAGP